MRAIIRDPRTGIRGLARRMPHPPEPPDPSPGVVAIQLSRLNEALLVAYSAMSPTNLNAVDQVVKIVRELDRYGGAFAAEWARPGPSHRIIPGSQPGDPGLDDVEDFPAFLVAALLPGQKPGVGDAVDDLVYKPVGAGDRPENPPQSVEKIDSAPGISILVAALPPGQSPRVGDAVDDRGYKPAGAGDRPENPAQSLEKIDSAPEFLVAALPPGQSPGGGDAIDDRVHKPVGAGDRPENPAQTSEKIDSAPGISILAAALPPGQSPRVGDAVDDRGYKPAGAGGRPENPAQSVEKIEIRARDLDPCSRAPPGSERGGRRPDRRPRPQARRRWRSPGKSGANL